MTEREEKGRGAVSKENVSMGKHQKEEQWKQRAVNLIIKVGGEKELDIKWDEIIIKQVVRFLFRA